MNERQWWRISILVSAVLIAFLGMLWVKKNEHKYETTQLVNNQAVENYLQHIKIKNDKNAPLLVQIKTGIFIQSLKFSNSTEINLTGYIWQRYEDNINETYKPSTQELGFIFPDQINSGGDIAPKEVYRIRQGNEEVIGWYFEATLKQPFNYADYPFDHKEVWVRLLPKNFNSNVVLVPDFASYKSTRQDDVFGIEENIVLGTWQRENTFFDFKQANYDTNFGIKNYYGQTGFPELYYNIVIKRKFVNAFIVYLMPLFLVAALLFAAMLTVSSNSELASKHGFSTSGILGTCSALFFVILLAHIQLREQFPGAGIVYLEYFYFIMYFFLVMATINTYLFSISTTSLLRIIHYKDNFIAKAACWPLLLSSMVIITSLSL